MKHYSTRTKTYSYTPDPKLIARSAFVTGEGDRNYHSLAELEAESQMRAERRERNRVELTTLGYDPDDVLFA